MYIGRPPQKFLDGAKAVIEGIEAALSIAKPGNTCEDIAEGFLHGCQEVRHRERRPGRLLRWDELPAGLGRAHHEFAGWGSY